MLIVFHIIRIPTTRTKIKMFKKKTGQSGSSSILYHRRVAQKDRGAVKLCGFSFILSFRAVNE
jgi:hypothetical protein